MVEKKTGAIKQAAIEHVVERRDWLVVGRLRLFRLKRAIDAYARRVDSELQECVEAGGELGAEIALPIWENVWKTSLQEEMRRACGVSEWTRPEQTLRKSAYGPLSFDDVLEFWMMEALEDCEVQDLLARQEGRRARRPTLRQIVLDQLRSAGREGSKAATIRTYATQVLQRDFHVKAVGMTLNRLATQGLARRKGHVWFPVGPSFEAREGRRKSEYPYSRLLSENEDAVSRSGPGAAVLLRCHRLAGVLRRPVRPWSDTSSSLVASSVQFP